MSKRCVTHSDANRLVPDPLLQGANSRNFVCSEWQDLRPRAALGFAVTSQLTAPSLSRSVGSLGFGQTGGRHQRKHALQPLPQDIAAERESVCSRNKCRSLLGDARRNVVPTLSPQLHRAILFEGAMERAISAKTPENIATRVPVYSSAPSIENGRRTFVDTAQFAAGSQDC